jgi:hypothetical protein
MTTPLVEWSTVGSGSQHGAGVLVLDVTAEPMQVEHEWRMLAAVVARRQVEAVLALEAIEAGTGL